MKTERNSKKHRLIETDWPEFGTDATPPETVAEEFIERINAARQAMAEFNLSHLVIYGDREHFANITYLSGIDPRFEEALMILKTDGNPLLIVGNECEGYLPFSSLFRAGRLRTERFQPFSLLDQPRNDSRLLKDILSGEAISAGSAIGCVGWKYFADSEQPDSAHAIEIPAYIVDTLRDLAGREEVINATSIFMNPTDGLRTYCSASEIAYFEYTGILASQAMKQIIFGMREGMTDYELANLVRTNGEPLGCHMTMATGKNRDVGLAGPSGQLISKGNPLSMNVCLWGSNCCRAGWIAESAQDLPIEAADYVENFAGVYFEVMAEWFSLLKIGTEGGQLAQVVDENLPFEKFGIFLNPGHLIHLDEWLSSPIYKGSTIRLHSGMAIQVDVIPSSKVYSSTRMEDGIVLADEALRKQLQTAYPDCFARCQKRREFMGNVLGIPLSDDLLPLSNVPAIVPPFFLRPQTIFAMER